ncbi:unnamed protein product [Periconia digitata]|uniref:Heterokaryon incompatibility domain-containing protein n=1 Tax=Periconia digitata TaxID=1303443 RepID=A0A9W4XTA1_9PLEO|nr:unnamed protein product [Periconia digitata]
MEVVDEHSALGVHTEGLGFESDSYFLITALSRVAREYRGPCSLQLCRWCQDNVFGSHTLRIIDTNDEYYLQNIGPFTRSIEDFATSMWGRTYSPTEVQPGKGNEQGCIFCSLLKSACLQFAKRSNQVTSTFNFDIQLKAAAEWSTIIFPLEGLEKFEPDVKFRLYTVNRNFIRSGLTTALLSTNEASLGDHKAVESPNPTLRHHNDWTDMLKHDGKVLRCLVDDCVQNHTTCSPDETQTLPSMLLQVSGTIESPSVRLVIVSEIEVRPIAYACLSYCWGGPQPGMTLSSRVAQYVKKIDNSAFPATPLDAIRITISLGLEYIWIDAFCIVQDSGRSKSLELGKMSSIYSGATVTICAMSSHKADDGLFPSARVRETRIDTHNIELHDTESRRAAVLEIRGDFSESNISEEPILTRAWTFQEALLSPRLIMIFSAGQRPIFRCSSHSIRSDGGKFPRYPKGLMTLDSIVARFQETNRHEGLDWGMRGIGQEWPNLVRDYTMRYTTFPDDTMAALSGVATRWQKSFGMGAYCAGLWFDWLTLDLMWQVPPDLSPRKPHARYVAPSWSWASRNHPIHYQSREDLDRADDLARVLECSVVPVHHKVPNGAIQSAKLVIECIAGEFRVDDNSNIDDSAEDLSHLPKIDGSIDFYFDDEPRSAEIRTIWLLIIAVGDPYQYPHPIGIGVVATGRNSDVGDELYRRVGWWESMVREKSLGEQTMKRFTII